MSLDLQVGNRWMANVDAPGMTVLDALSPSGDKCEFTLNFTQHSPWLVPQTEQEVTVYWSQTDPGGVDPLVTLDPIFGGVIEEVEWRRLSPHQYQVTVRCTDYLKRFDRKNFYGVYIQTDPAETLRAIIDDHLPEFSYTSTSIAVPSGVYIYPRSFDLQPPSNAFNEITDLVKFTWYIDFEKVVHFVNLYAAAQDAPIPIIEVDTETRIGDFVYSINSDELKNTIIARDFFRRGDTSISSQVHAVTAQDLEPTDPSFSFPGGYLPWSIEDDDLSIELDQGAGYVVQRKRSAEVWGLPLPVESGVVYIDLSRGLYRFPSTILAVGNNVRVSYRPVEQSRVPEVLHDVLSIALVQEREGGDSTGVYEYITDLSKEEFYSLDDLMQVLQRIIDIYGMPRITGSFVVYSDQSYGWRPGQRFTAISYDTGLYDIRKYFNGEGLVGATLFVTSVTTKVINNNTLRYEVSFSSIPREV